MKNREDKNKINRLIIIINFKLKNKQIICTKMISFILFIKMVTLSTKIK